MRPGIRGWRLGRRRLVCAGRRGIRPVRKPLAVGEQRRALDGSPQQAAETGPLLCQVIRRRGDDVERHAPRQRVASEPGQFARVARPLDQQEVQVAVRPHLAQPPRENQSQVPRGADPPAERLRSSCWSFAARAAPAASGGRYAAGVVIESRPLADGAGSVPAPWRRSGENRREARVRGRRGVSLALLPFLSIVPRAPPLPWFVIRAAPLWAARPNRRSRAGGCRRRTRRRR